MVQSKVSPTDYVKAALAYLAGRCDGAIEDDGVGFNGSDASFGKSLASRDRLSPNQTVAAAEMLQKYRKQLSVGGIELPTVDEVKDAIDRSGVPVAREVIKRDRPVLKARSGESSVVEPIAVPTVSVITEKPWITSKWREGLSEQQQEAFDRIHEWYFGENPRKFVLRGFGGTGKSFTAQRIAHSIQSIVKQTGGAGKEGLLGYTCRWDSSIRSVVRTPLRDRVKIGLCAPTHKAVEVLQRFASAAELDVEIGTIHSFLHVAPGEFEADGRQKLVEVFSKADHYDSFGLMIVDESSMIGQELLDFIPDNVPTLFMGDSAQLPPVCPDEADPKDSPVFSIEPSFQLTHVMRYDGGILAMATDIRNNLECQYPPKIPMKAENIMGLGTIAWEQELIKSFKASNFAENPNAIRALAFRNQRVQELNQLVRSALYPDAIERYEPGEILVAKEPVFVWNSEWGREEIAMQTCQECTVISSGVYHDTIKAKIPDVHGNPIEKELRVKLYDLRVRSAGLELRLKSVHDDSMAEVSALLKQFNTAILAMGKGEKQEVQKRMRKSYWAAYFWLLKDYGLVSKGAKFIQRLQYAYSLTIHQSQGSTIDVVFADFKDIFAGRHSKTKNQLRYVALTRAKECAVILK